MEEKMRKNITLIILIILLFVGCTKSDDLQTMQVSSSDTHYDIQLEKQSIPTDSSVTESQTRGMFDLDGDGKKEHIYKIDDKIIIARNDEVIVSFDPWQPVRKEIGLFIIQDESENYYIFISGSDHGGVTNVYDEYRKGIPSNPEDIKWESHSWWRQVFFYSFHNDTLQLEDHAEYSYTEWTYRDTQEMSREYGSIIVNNIESSENELTVMFSKYLIDIESDEEFNMR